MVSVQRISLVTDGHEADETLIREYVVLSLDRLNAINGCEGVRFSRFGTDPRYEKSEVKLGIYGDHEAVIETERDRWDNPEARGMIDLWSRNGASFAGQAEEVQEFLGRLYVLASRMSAEYYRAFDERPAMIDTFPDEGGPMRTGWWMLPHLLVNQAGYDTDEEIDGYFQAMRERLLVLTQLRDYEDARERVDDLQSRLDDVEARIDGIEEQGGLDYYADPE